MFIINWLDLHSGSVIALLTFIFIFVTGIYVLITFLILRTTTKQTEIINRPYLYLSNFNAPINKNIIKIEFDLQNAGRLLAKDLKVKFALALPIKWILSFVDEDEGSTYPIPKDEILPAKFSSQSIIPNDKITLKYEIETEKDIRSILEYADLCFSITFYYRGLIMLDSDNDYKTVYNFVRTDLSTKWSSSNNFS